MANEQRVLHVAPESDYAVSPGDSLRLRLEELGMSQADLARRTGLTTKHVNQVLKGSASLSADVARRLEYATGTPTRWWLRLEADYRAEQQRLAENHLVTPDLSWVRTMPVSALVAAGALPARPTDGASRLSQLLRFFGVASVDAYRQVWARPVAAFRQSAAFDIEPSAVTCWLRLGELADQSDPPSGGFDLDGIRQAVPRLRALTREPIQDGAQRLVEVCRGRGVNVVFVPEIPGARAYGATRWLASGRRPLIQLSLRGGTDDTFWFTVFHELAHLVLHDRKSIYIDEDESAQPNPSDGEETEANAWAWAQLIPPDDQRRLPALQTNEDVLDFAESIGIGASLVVARLHRDGHWGYRQGARLKRPVTSTLLKPRPTDDGERAQRRRARRLPGDPG